MSYFRRLIDKFLAPSHWLHFFLNVIAMLIALEVSGAVLVRNLRDNVYPMEADSIGIPLMGMMFGDIVALVILLFGMRLARKEARIWIGCGVLGLLAWWHFIEFFDWADPRHYEIGIAQASLGLPLLLIIYLEIRRYRRQPRSDVTS
jgi:hypothetical protein